MNLCCFRNSLIFILYFFLCHVCQSQTTLSPLELELIVPVSTPAGDRVISMDRYPRIHVRITNVSNQPQRLWKDWNSWGWFNLTLQMVTETDTTIISRKRPDHWDGDFSDFWLLQQNESIILEVDLTTATWKGFPDLYGESLSVTLTAIYQNKPDILAEEFGIWTGKLESKTIKVVMR